MALDSTPDDLGSAVDPGPDPNTDGLRSRSTRKLLLTLILGFSLLTGLVATGVADAAEHAISHAFPGLMPEGCGEPAG